MTDEQSNLLDNVELVNNAPPVEDIEVIVSPVTPVIRPAGRECTLWNDHLFKQLREAHGVSDSFVNEGWDFSELVPSHGKGGGLMIQLFAKFVVKQISADDHKALLTVAQSYTDHMINGKSLITRIFAHFTDVQTKRHFIVMRHEVGVSDLDAQYDIKGCNDDKMLIANGKKLAPVHKRIWYFWMWGGKCCWSEERVKYFDGKVNAKKVNWHVYESDFTELSEAIKADTEWLSKNHFMDYSLLVAQRKGPPGFADGDCMKKPYILRTPDGDVALYISIIDFLQVWTCSKKVAKCVKCFEQNKSTIHPQPYGMRFIKNCTNRFKAIPNPQEEASLAIVEKPVEIVEEESSSCTTF